MQHACAWIHVRLSLRQMQQVFGKGAAKVVLLGTPTERTVAWRGTGRATEAAFSLLGAAQCYPFFPFSTLISLSVYLFFAGSSFCLACPPFLQPSPPPAVLTLSLPSSWSSLLACGPSISILLFALPSTSLHHRARTHCAPRKRLSHVYARTCVRARAPRTCACARPLLMRAIEGKEGQQVDACMRGLSNTARMCARVRVYVRPRVAGFSSPINARRPFILIIITCVGPLGLAVSLIRRRI